MDRHPFGGPEPSPPMDLVAYPFPDDSQSVEQKVRDEVMDAVPVKVEQDLFRNPGREQ